jgi:type I restriction enzyme S subunit
MTPKPGYKQTEVGPIPQDWEVRRLAEITDPQRPISYGIVQTGANVPNGIPCLRVVDINEGQISKLDLITTTKEISDAYRRTVLRAGDLVMPLRGKVGDVAIIDADLEDANLTRGVALIAVQPSWHGPFVQQFISWSATRRRLEQTMNGSALQEIPIATMRSFQIGLPPSSEEQRAIAAALSDADEWIASLDRLIAKKRDIKQAAMQQLLTGKTRLPGFQSKSGFKQTEVGKIPHDWELIPFSDLMSFRNGLNAGREAYGRGTPFINVLEVISNTILEFDDIPGKISAGANALFLYEVKSGDILFNRTSETQDEVGLAAVYLDSRTVVFGGFVIRARIISPHLDPRFSAYALRAPTIRKQIISRGQGAVRANVGQGDLKKILFPLPPPEEQRAIAEALSDIEAELAAFQAKREKARSIKQGMMQELLTGRVRLI